MHRLLLISTTCWAMLISYSAVTQAEEVLVDTEARVIVKYKADSALLREDVPSASARQTLQAQALGKRVGIALRAGAGVADRTQVVFAAGTTSEQLAKRLAAEGDIEYAVPDKRRRHTSAPNDPFYMTGGSGGPAVGQWYLRAPAGELQSSINVEPAWDLSSGGASIVVAVLDTGVRFDHPDLKTVAAGGSLLPGYDMISDVDVANDGDGRDPDASDPGDWVAEADQSAGPFFGCTVEDSSWHGTQTSALIGALTNNGIGMASVGRGNVRILPVRVLGKCGGFDSDIIAGMLWAVGLGVPDVPTNANPARVLNLSLGGDDFCSNAYLDAVARITALGAVVVVAAGNSSLALGAPGNCPGVVTVAGLRQTGTKVGFSSLGAQVSISAPGGNCGGTDTSLPCLYPILSAANAGLTMPVLDAVGGSIYTDGFKPSLGTSFSAPLVSGTVALMLSVQPSLTPAQVTDLLRSSARPFPTADSGTGDGTHVPQCVTPPAVGLPQSDQGECFCTSTTCGAGMLDAGAAVRAALAGVPPPVANGTRTATEFYHPVFDHYFITSDAAETAALAAGNLPPWVPTGQTFKVWDRPDTNITNVCRFFTNYFLPQSAHYYSNRDIECPGLQARGPWALEELDAFYVMPVQTACPPGTLPLYRLYNNDRGGAPNWRYTIDLLTRSSMIAANWVPDGDGEDGVFACVPP